MQKPKVQPWALRKNSSSLQVETRNGLTAPAEARTVVHGVERLSLTSSPVYTQRDRFRKLHPRSLLERR